MRWQEVCCRVPLGVCGSEGQYLRESRPNARAAHGSREKTQVVPEVEWFCPECTRKIRPATTEARALLEAEHLARTASVSAPAAPPVPAAPPGPVPAAPIPATLAAGSVPGAQIIECGRPSVSDAALTADAEVRCKELSGGILSSIAEMTARIDEDAAFGWRYIDDSHRQQGPFSNMQMRMWFIEDRYRVRMKPNLYVQRTSDGMAAMQRIGMPLIGHGLVSHAGFEQLDLVFRGHTPFKKSTLPSPIPAVLTSPALAEPVVSESFSSSITGTRGAAAGNEAPVAPLGVSTGMPMIGAVTATTASVASPQVAATAAMPLTKSAAAFALDAGQALSERSSSASLRAAPAEPSSRPRTAEDMDSRDLSQETSQMQQSAPASVNGDGVPAAAASGTSAVPAAPSAANANGAAAVATAGAAACAQAAAPPGNGMSRYMRFCQEQRPKVQQANPQMTSAALFLELGARWRLLPAAEKERYQAFLSPTDDGGEMLESEGEKKLDELDDPDTISREPAANARPSRKRIPTSTFTPGQGGGLAKSTKRK